MSQQFTFDGTEIPFEHGQTIMDAVLAAGGYIPHLCHNPEFAPHGSCRVCTVRADGRNVAACTQPALAGTLVESDTPNLQSLRRGLLQMLFVEGNHLCPGCEKSGACQLQAVAYHCGMLAPEMPHFFPRRVVDASHPDIAIDYGRCILCELCVRASRDVDGKDLFAIGGRGLDSHLLVNSASGKLADTSLSLDDKAAHVCPVGAILIKHRGYDRPIGRRLYDTRPINEAGDVAEAEKSRDD